MDPRTLNLTLPELPSDLLSLIPPPDGVGVRLNSGGLDRVNGFNDLLQMISDNGGVFETTIFGGTEFVQVERNIPTFSRVIVNLIGGKINGIGGVDLTIDYDEIMVTPLSVTALGVAIGAKLEINPANGMLKIVIINQNEGGLNPGDFLQLDFNNIGGGIPTSATYPVSSIEVTDINGSNITSQTGIGITVLNGDASDLPTPPLSGKMLPSMDNNIN